MANPKIVQASSVEKRGFQRRQQVLVRRRQVFANMSPAACARLTAAWSGAVGGMLLIMILARLFS